MRGEFHILQEFIEYWWIEKKEKKVRKKGSTFCISKKVRLEGSPKVAPFFNRGIKEHYPNDCLLVQNVHTMFWRRSGKKEEKKR
jgi:hypothetical protein